MYTKKILDRFLALRNAGLIKGADAVGSSQNEKNGETAKIYLKVEDGIIKDANFKVFGGAVTMAIFDEAMEMLKDKDIDFAVINEDEIASALGGIEKDRTFAFLLLREAFEDAKKDYVKKQKRLKLKLLREQVAMIKGE